MRTRLLSLGLAAALGVLALAPTAATARATADTLATATSGPGPAASRALPAHRPGAVAPRVASQSRRAARARALLSDAHDLLRDGIATTHHGAATRQGRDATLVLTQLRHHLGDLASSDDRRRARAILARPTYGGKPTTQGEHAYTVREQPPVCDAHVCIHYVTSSPDKVSTAGRDADGVPAYVRQAQRVFAHVWSTEVDEYGYHHPMGDLALAQHGVDGKLDVYLQDLATDTSGLYGYCAPDTARRRTPGYCVLENDYAEAPFRHRTPLANFEVTAAHEFFHAVQFSYDSYESRWLMEGTAAWMEDEVYTSVNDNRQYLSESPLTEPFLPLDYANYDSTYSPYGGWIFWRFLSEWAGPGASDDPSIVRDVWDDAASTSSLGALSATLVARHTSLPVAYRTFGTWTRSPRHFFREGAAYSPARTAKSFVLSGSHPDSGVWQVQLSHLSRDFVRFRPATTLHGDWRLRIRLNLADRSRGSLAEVVTHHPDGTMTTHDVALDSHGDATAGFVFSPSRVAFVDLDLMNASSKAADDYRTGSFSGMAVR